MGRMLVILAILAAMKNQPNAPQDRRGGPPKGNNGRNRFKQRPPRNFWKSLLTNKIFDLVIVVVGVSIAFYLNSLKTNADKRELEKFYVENISRDLTADIAELSKNLEDIDRDYQLLVSYVQQYGEQKAVGDSLASVIANILSLNTFEPNDNAYQSLLGANGLEVFSTPELRSLTTNYYNSYRRIKRFEEVYTKAIFDIYSFFTPYCDYTLRRIVDKSVLTKVQTKNSLLIAAAQLEDGIESYDEALIAAKALQKALSEVQ